MAKRSTARSGKQAPAQRGRRGPPPASPAVQALRKTAPSRRTGSAGVGTVAPAATGPLLPVKAPPHLMDEAKDCWERITKLQVDLRDAGQAPMITAAEWEMLEHACVAYRHWRLAVDAFNERLESIRDRSRRMAKEAKANKNLEPPSPHAWHQGQQVARTGKDGSKELVISSYQLLVERTGEACRKAFAALGLPRRMPMVIAQIEEQTASGDRKAMRLMLGGS